MIKYPNGVKPRFPYKPKSHEHTQKGKRKINKFNALRTTVDGITFDSKLEGRYYEYLKTLKLDFKYHERFEICPKFELNGKTYRKRTYTPDFSIYTNGKLTGVIDTKGSKATVTTDSRLRMVLFMYQYQIPVVIARWDAKTKTFKESVE